jgi:hypothetical protein
LEEPVGSIFRVAILKADGVTSQKIVISIIRLYIVRFEDRKAVTEDNLLGCDIVCPGRSFPMFLGNALQLLNHPIPVNLLIFGVLINFYGSKLRERRIYRKSFMQ